MSKPILSDDSERWARLWQLDYNSVVRLSNRALAAARQLSCREIAEVGLMLLDFAMVDLKTQRLVRPLVISDLERGDS